MDEGSHMFVTIRDPNDMFIQVSAPGNYSPDVMNDLKNRALDAYGDALQMFVDEFGVCTNEHGEVETETEATGE